MTLTPLTFYAPPAVGGVIPPLQIDLNLPGGGGDPTMGGDISGTASTSLIVAGAVTTGKLAAGAVTDAKAGALTTAALSASAGILKSQLAALGIVDADVAGGAAISYGKLALANSILNADIGAAAAIAYSKLNLAGSIVNADINASAAIAKSKLAALAIVDGDVSAISESKVTNLVSDLAAKATDSLAAHLAGAEAFTGVKTFTAGPVFPTQAKSANATLVDGSQPVVLCDTSGGVFTLTLPAAPTAGSSFLVIDSGGAWATNNLTIARNGKNIDGAAANFIGDTNNGIVGLYYDGTGWRTNIDMLSSASPVMDGTAAAGTSQKVARADHVHPSDTTKANLAGPTFTGVPAGPTAAIDTNTTQFATTAFVLAQAAAAAPLAAANPAVGTSTRYARADHVHPGRDFYLNGGVNHVRETTPRRTLGSADMAALTSGQMLCAAIELFAGDVITNLTFRTGATAAGTPTHWWLALYDTQATPALLSQTADQTTGAIAASTNFTKALNAAQTIVTSGVYYICLMVAATTVPTLRGLALGNSGISSAILAGQKTLAQTSGSALTTTAPGTIASPSASGQLLYAVTS